MVETKKLIAKVQGCQLITKDGFLLNAEKLTLKAEGNLSAVLSYTQILPL
jgi:hypothetical protein